MHAGPRWFARNREGAERVEPGGLPLRGDVRYLEAKKGENGQGTRLEANVYCFELTGA